MVYTILRALAAVLFKILFRLEVHGKENIPKAGGFILASNHASYLDPIAIGIASSRKLNYMARHDLFYNPFFSWLLNNIGVFPVKRYSADVRAIRKAMRLVEHGNALVIFPEGSRQFDGTPSEIQSGIGFLAAKLNVPVIPAFIRGTDIALPRHAKFIRPSKVSVFIGRQIYIERRLPYQEITRQIMQNIFNAEHQVS